MSKIRFVALPEEIFDATVSDIGPNQVRIVFPEDTADIPDIEDILSGFYILNEHNLEIMNSYEDYNYIYREYTGGFLYELDNDNVPWVEPEPPYVPPTPPEPPAPIPPKVGEVLDQKLQEFSSACGQAIEAGVDVEIDGANEHFSYSLSGGDQNNIDDIFNALLNTGLPQYYHCDGGLCKLYDKWQVFAIYSTEKGNKMDHTTYYNEVGFQLRDKYKDVLESDDPDTVAEIQALVYKEVALEGQYLQNYTQIMTDMGATIEAYREIINNLEPVNEEEAATEE